MTPRLVIEGEVATPETRATWSCPLCSRVVTDETGRLFDLMCAGHPITGASHPVAAMRSSRSTSTAIQVWNA